MIFKCVSFALKCKAEKLYTKKMVHAVQFFNKMIPTGLYLLESVMIPILTWKESQDSVAGGVMIKAKNGMLCEANIFVL